jgi:hypothetical protein
MTRSTVLRRFEPAVPLELGRLLDLEAIRTEFFANVARKPSRKWIRARLPVDKRVPVGRAFCWYEADVRVALSSLRGAA